MEHTQAVEAGTQLYEISLATCGGDLREVKDTDIQEILWTNRIRMMDSEAPNRPFKQCRILCLCRNCPLGMTRLPKE